MNATQEYQLELRELRRPWVDDALPRLATMLPALGEFTSDDLHDRLPKPEHDNWYGVLVAAARNKGLIERVGARPSCRDEANGRWIAVWRARQA